MAERWLKVVLDAAEESRKRASLNQTQPSSLRAQGVVASSSSNAQKAAEVKENRRRINRKVSDLLSNWYPSLANFYLGGTQKPRKEESRASRAP